MNIIVVIVLMFVVIAGSSVDYRIGERVGERTTVQLETSIDDLIVSRNPRAAIADFRGFAPHVIAESARAKIDWRLTLAIIDHESGFDPRAVGRAGEVGLMQLLPSTAASVAREMGRDDLSELTDPRVNVTLGLAYLAKLRDRFGGVSGETLRAYNRGPARARERWPRDRYAEQVALRFVRIASSGAMGLD